MIFLDFIDKNSFSTIQLRLSPYKSCPLLQYSPRTHQHLAQDFWNSSAPYFQVPSANSGRFFSPLSNGPLGFKIDQILTKIQKKHDLTISCHRSSFCGLPETNSVANVTLQFQVLFFILPCATTKQWPRLGFRRRVSQHFLARFRFRNMMVHYFHMWTFVFWHFYFSIRSSSPSFRRFFVLLLIPAISKMSTPFSQRRRSKRR